MTIKDIAQLSGFAVSTVSRALNNHPDVSKKTKEKIDKIVKEYNFKPNKNARGLKAQKSNSICVIIKGNYNVFFTDLAEQIKDVISQNHYICEVHNIDENQNEVQVAKQICDQTMPLGVMFLGANEDNFENDFSDIKIPCVCVGTLFKKFSCSNLSVVSVNHEKSAESAVQYLIDNNHKEIGIIGSNPQVFHSSRQKLEGVINCFKNNNFVFDANYFQTANYTYTSAYKATKILFSIRPNTSAIFAMSDVMAIGCVRAAADLGKRIPQDVSIMGFDGLEIGDYFLPKLTSIKQPLDEIVQTATQQIILQIQKKAKAKTVVVDTFLKDGESVSKKQ